VTASPPRPGRPRRSSLVRALAPAVTAAALWGAALPAAAQSATPGEVALVSRAPTSPSTTANGRSEVPPEGAVDRSGALVVFQSTATNLVDGQRDAVGTDDVFLLDRGTGTITLVSRAAGSTTTAANGASTAPQLSANGTVVVFQSVATNLVAGQDDTNGALDTFVFDRATGAVSLASHTPAGPTTTANAASGAPGARPSVSANGDVVAFSSAATNLVAGQDDTNGGVDAFVFQLSTGAVTLVSHTPASAASAANAPVFDPPRLSANGSTVVFSSSATNLAAGQSDTNLALDVFAFDRATGAVALLSRSATSSATTANSTSGAPSVSGDGTVVAFTSFATNLVAGQQDGANAFDVFILDRRSATMTLASRVATTTSTAANAESAFPKISEDGSTVVFVSSGTDLAIGQSDANGAADAFAFTRATGVVAMVSRTAAGAATAGNAGISGIPSVSADGAVVAFDSFATNLVAGQEDGNGRDDAFVFDRGTGAVTLVSHRPTAPRRTADANSFFTSVSASGTVVVFNSGAGDLVTNQADDNRASDAFVFDRPGARAPTTVALTTVPNPSSGGEPVTITARLSWTSAATPTGTISFRDSSAVIGTQPVASGSASLTLPLTVGNHSLSAVYSGDGDFAPSTSPTHEHFATGGGGTAGGRGRGFASASPGVVPPGGSLRVSVPAASLSSGTAARFGLRRLDGGITVPLGTAVVDSSGAAGLDAVVPPATPVGNYFLVVDGTGTGGADRVLLATVVVGPTGPTAANSTPVAAGALAPVGIALASFGRHRRRHRRGRAHGGRPLALVVIGALAVGAVAAPVGGTAAVTTRRLADADRFGTARAIAVASFASAPVPILATAENFPDALAASYLTGAARSPILLTNRDDLSAETVRALVGLGAAGVQVVGGAAGVSDAVVADLRRRGLVVDRLAGGDRYATARAIAESVPAEAIGSAPGQGRTAIVVTGEGFADALAAGPVAHALGFPVLLSAKAGLSGAAAAAFSTLGIRHVILAGGPEALSEDVAAQIAGRNITVRRIAGTSRSATATALAQVAIDEFGFTPAHANLARGDEFADALAGAPHAGQERAPVLLTANRDTLDDATADFLRRHAPTLASLDVLGGPAAVSDATVGAARTAAGGG